MASESRTAVVAALVGNAALAVNPTETSPPADFLVTAAAA